jgi:hypothetical protein
MTTATEEPVTLERKVAGMGTIQFEEGVRRDGKTYRNYWLLKEGGARRERLTSVTTILRATWPKPGLLEWYAREGAGVDTALEKASARGRSVHHFVEHFMTTGDLLDFDFYPPEYAPYLTGAARFLWEKNPMPLAVERLVAYPELGYAGRLDLIALMDGEPTLLDFKSNPSGRIYPEAHVQAHAYRIAEKRCTGAEVEATSLVAIAEDGTYRVQRGADASKMWGAVLDFHKTLARFDKELEKVAA